VSPRFLGFPGFSVCTMGALKQSGFGSRDTWILWS
jgi:hypothetical protein